VGVVSPSVSELGLDAARELTRAQLEQQAAARPIVGEGVEAAEVGVRDGANQTHLAGELPLVPFAEVHLELLHRHPELAKQLAGEHRARRAVV
jgi:hypothetical protein